MPMDLELWQVERCAASHRVRRRLCELALAYLARPVPVAREDRAELEHATGVSPVFVAGSEIIAGE